MYWYLEPSLGAGKSAFRSNNICKNSLWCCSLVPRRACKFRTSNVHNGETGKNSLMDDLIRASCGRRIGSVPSILSPAPTDPVFKVIASHPAQKCRSLVVGISCLWQFDMPGSSSSFVPFLPHSTSLHFISPPGLLHQRPLSVSTIISIAIRLPFTFIGLPASIKAFFFDYPIFIICWHSTSSMDRTSQSDTNPTAPVAERRCRPPSRVGLPPPLVPKPCPAEGI